LEQGAQLKNAASKRRSRTGVHLVRAWMIAAQRIAHQPPRARRKNGQNSYDLAREAVGCMGVLGST
jgi:hypothetical protein